MKIVILPKFLVCVNDLTRICNALLQVMCADDSNFFVAGKNIDEIFHSINTELEKHHEIRS